MTATEPDANSGRNNSGTNRIISHGVEGAHLQTVDKGKHPVQIEVDDTNKQVRSMHVRNAFSDVNRFLTHIALITSL